MFTMVHQISYVLFTLLVLVKLVRFRGEQSQGVIKQIYFDNAPVLLDGAYITTEGQVPTSMMIEKYRKYLQIEVRFGKPSYGGSMTLALQYGGSQWNDNMRGDGLVQICTVIKKTNDSLIDGILTNQNYTLSVEMRGRMIYDLTDNVRKPSSNPPSQLYDFITNTEFGFGLNPNDIDMTSFRNMANYCANNHFIQMEIFSTINHLRKTLKIFYRHLVVYYMNQMVCTI